MVVGTRAKTIKNWSLQTGDPGGPESAQCLSGHSHHPRLPCTLETVSSLLYHPSSMCLSLSLVGTLL